MEVVVFALIAFLIFIILQIPATWLISKFSKNNQTVHNVSGNIWQGRQTGTVERYEALSTGKRDR